MRLMNTLLKLTMCICFGYTILYYNRRYNDNNTLKSIQEKSNAAAKTSLRSSPQDTQDNQDKRISSLWIIKETKATMEVLLFLQKTNEAKQIDLFNLPREKSSDYEIPQKAAIRLLLRLGLGQHEVESMHVLRHGEFQNGNELLHDATSYVAVVAQQEHVDIVTQMAQSYSGSSERVKTTNVVAEWVPVSKVADMIAVYQNPTQQSKTNGIGVGMLVVDDYPSLREFLEPFVLTAGKNPGRFKNCSLTLTQLLLTRTNLSFFYSNILFIIILFIVIFFISPLDNT